jgi:hypothetical protein
MGRIWCYLFVSTPLCLPVSPSPHRLVAPSLSLPIFHNPPFAQADHTVGLSGQRVVVRDQQQRRRTIVVEFDEQIEDAPTIF